MNCSEDRARDFFAQTLTSMWLANIQQTEIETNTHSPLGRTGWRERVFA